MVDVNNVVSKAVTYYCLFAMTCKSMDNLAKVNKVDSTLTAKNAFTQVKAGAKMIDKRAGR